MKKVDDTRTTEISYKDFKEAFFQEGISQEKIINHLWNLRLGHYDFTDSFKTKEELRQAIRDFREFISQLLYSNSPV